MSTFEVRVFDLRRRTQRSPHQQPRKGGISMFPDINLRALGHAYGLAALVSIIPERPLYVSYDVSAKVLDMATQLLKRRLTGKQSTTSSNCL